MSKWGKHIAAIAVFLVLTVIYFSPAVFEGKVVRQGDTEKAIGMGNSQMDEYEKTAQPGEFSAWSDAMFGGMPYVSGYGNPALVTKAFAKNHKVVELNGNSVNVRRDGIPNMKLLLAACLKNGCHIALDTDAHSTTQLQGNMPPLLAMLEEMQFPQELVVNATRQNLVNELKLHGRICAEYIGGEIL